MPTKTSPEIEARVCELRRSWRRGPHLLAGRLQMAPSTVHAILARHGLSRLSRLDRVTGEIIRYERDHPGELIHVDVKKLGRIPDGGGWRVHGRENRPANKRGNGYDFLHVAIDDHSRVVFVQIHPDEKGTTCAEFLTDAFVFFDQLGVTVERVMTDNAKNYVISRAFQAALDGRKHQRIRPHRPQTNGKVERFNRTLTSEWAYARVYNSNDERSATLDEWVRDYNYNRTHSGIGNHPPASRLPSTT
jgi:transposase InsO family protein